MGVVRGGRGGAGGDAKNKKYSRIIYKCTSTYIKFYKVKSSIGDYICIFLLFFNSQFFFLHAKTEFTLFSFTPVGNLSYIHIGGADVVINYHTINELSGKKKYILG